jgi:hypothetical protein
VHTGYRRREIFKAYTLFLILLPVVLVGVMNSILQIMFGGKANFGRTPKVAHRTAVPASIHFCIWGLFVWSILTGYDDLTSDKELHAIFAGSNALALGYGIFVLIGIRGTLQDMLLGLQVVLGGIWKRLPLPKRMRTADPLSPSRKLVKPASISAAPLHIDEAETAARGQLLIAHSKISMQGAPSPDARKPTAVDPTKRYAG